jgi:hypothetical protein
MNYEIWGSYGGGREENCILQLFAVCLRVLLFDLKDGDVMFL